MNFKSNTLLTLLLAGLMVLSFGTVQAQDDGEKKGKISGGFGYFTPGFTQLDLVATNSFLVPLGYSELSGNQITLGGGGFVMVRNFMLGGEGHSLLKQDASSALQNAQLQGGWGQFQLGYIAFSRRGFLLYPRVGVGGYNHRIQLTKNGGNATNADDFFGTTTATGTFNGTEIVRTGLLLSGEIGMEFMPGFDESSGSGLTFGLNVGYNYAATANAWTAYDVELQNGPDLDMSGLFVRLHIGFAGWHRQ